jgi:hypothetical protein
MLKARAASVTQNILFAAIFAALQIVAVSHNTAHGDVGHAHEGTPCIFQIASDAAQDTTTARDGRPSYVVSPIRYTPLTTFRRDLRVDGANSIRGPPSL